MSSAVFEKRIYVMGFFVAIVFGQAVVGFVPQAFAATYLYVDWTEADVSQGTAQGTITLSDNSIVTVIFEATNPDGTPGNLYGAQVDGGIDYWVPSSPYISEEVENAPPDSDILQLSGGQDQIYTVTLSEAIKDPVMAIVSLGSHLRPITYDFDAPFTIVSQGEGYWGGGEFALSQLPGDVLHGVDGHGTIKFLGTFSTFSWTAPEPETWHGFTFAIRTAERLEPPPDAGVPDAGIFDAGIVDAGIVDAMIPDAGIVDAMIPDASVADASAVDAGRADAGRNDAGNDDDDDDDDDDNGMAPPEPQPRPPGGCGGCSCRIGGSVYDSRSGTIILLFSAIIVVRLRRRSHSGTG